MKPKKAGKLADLEKVAFAIAVRQYCGISNKKRTEVNEISLVMNDYSAFFYVIIATQMGKNYMNLISTR